MIRVHIVRHGQTAWNAGDQHEQRFRGTVDLPLSDQGVAQSRSVARRLASCPMTAVYASPLQRAGHTARIVAEAHDLPVQTLTGLSSMDYGDWAGKRHADVALGWPEQYRQWNLNPFAVQIPGGEHLSDLKVRAVGALYEALARHEDGDTLVLVSHQVVTRALICALAQLPEAAYWHFGQYLCNITTFDFDPSHRGFFLVGLNDTCHLGIALPQISGGEMRIILLRHGQTAWNAGAGKERFRGRMDLPLDEHGFAQAQAIARRLSDEPVAAIYSSPLLRTRQTIAPLVDALSSTGIKARVHEGLIDIDYGAFQGLSHGEAAKVYPHVSALWQSHPGQVCFPQGESLSAVQYRLQGALDEMLRLHPGETVIWVGHQIVNKVMACTLLVQSLDWIGRIEQHTAGVNVIQWGDGVWRVICLNDICHL